jgi:protein ImuB
MRLWIAVNLYQLALDVFCPNWSVEPESSAQLAVLEREKVLYATPGVVAQGVRTGMRAASVALLAPEARVQLRDLALEQQTLQACALALLQYTPQCALAEQATLMLDIGASLRLFGGIRALSRRVRTSVQRLGLAAHISYAPTARGAWLLAQAGAGHCLSSMRLAQRLGRLPVALLPPLQPYLAWLDGIGCTDLAALRRLPRAGLQRRCGKEVLDMLDAAHGQAPELFEWLQAPTQFRARIEFFQRIEHTDAMHHASASLLTQMSGWLCAQHGMVGAIRVVLEHERGRCAVPPTCIDIVLAEPTWQETHLLMLLKERLSKIELVGPVMALRLEADEVLPMLVPSDSLFPEPGGTVADYQRLLELLSVRLGTENVRHSQLRADHRPEVANQWVAVNTGRGKPAPRPPADLPRPCWLLEQPIALLIRDNRPFYGSPLKLISQAERIESGWWQGDVVMRDYFVAQGQDHACYWIYRERLAHEPRWFLHGLFG